MEPAQSANWLEGFLSGSGNLLAHDQALIGLIHTWLTALPADTFQETLPLLARTFGSFTSPERARIAATIKNGNFESTNAPTTNTWDINEENALPALRTVATLLDLP